jgi:hypothetical protein
MESRPQRAKNWHHWFYLHSSDSPRPLKSEIAERLGLSSADFSKRLDPARYQPAVSDREIALTAEMWGQSESYVRKIFPRKAA